MIAHFTGELTAIDPLGVLSDARLNLLASPMFAAWPVARAINTRMYGAPNATLLSALIKLAPSSRKNAGGDPATDPDDYMEEILQTPARFPRLWVLEAERRRSIMNHEIRLEQYALGEDWMPKVPRL